MTIPALCKSDTGFQFPARLNTYCSAGVQKGLFIFVCEFVHYVPARRKNAISILSAYYEHFRGLLAVSVPGTSIGVDLMLGDRLCRVRFYAINRRRTARRASARAGRRRRASDDGLGAASYS